MSIAQVEGIANAVLYEGYILYPYRPTSIKNRQRWTFGGVFPQAYGGRQGDPCTMQTQVLLRSSANAMIGVHVRFLQVIERTVGKLADPLVAWPETGEPDMNLVPRLEVGDRDYTAWDEAIEREIALKDLIVTDLARAPRRAPFSFSASRELEPVRAPDGAFVAALVRTGAETEGVIEVAAETIDANLVRLSVRIDNTTPLSPSELAERDPAQRRAFVATHTILEARDCVFVSLMDPPAALRDVVAKCDNRGTFPVLVGEAGSADTMLSSPIILYDYPQIAPESAGDLFDGTEIDEILTLRILAMTDAEKREMAAADPRAAALLERTHAMAPEAFARLHGAMRGAGVGSQSFGLSGREEWRAPKPRLASLVDGPAMVAIGCHVRIRPKPGGDIMDIALKDKIAVVEAIERDFEDRVHVAVTLLDDPGQDLGAAGFPGHRFYFARDEIEPLADGEAP